MLTRARAISCALAGCLAATFASCSDSEGGIDSPKPSGGEAGSSGSSSGGSSNVAGSSGSASLGGAGEGGGAAGGSSNAAGSQGEGGAPVGGSGGTSPTSCVYADDVAEGGAGGEAGAPGSSGIGVRTSVFGGQHLTDAEGRPLYTFGADRPGNCNDAPLGTCVATCLNSWLPFSDPATSLDASLDANAFGSILDPSGNRISTYFGWPLYYFANDVFSAGPPARWSVGGQGIGRIWHLAKVRPSNIVLLKMQGVATLYLASGSGMTLYTYAQDTSGAEPESACTGACLDDYQPMLTNAISAVSSLDSADLSLFVRPDSGKLQVAFKGAPLYVSAADQKPGDMLGIEDGVWAIMNP